MPMPTFSDFEIVTVPNQNPCSIVEILLLGTGTSTCVPNIGCLAREERTCEVCLDSVGMLQRSPEYYLCNGGPPLGTASRNRRTNPSAVLRYSHSDGTTHSILIDCGKSFYTNALAHMMRGGVRKLDGVILTHGHADAILGIDDLRHWSGHRPNIQPYVDVFCDRETFETVKQTFPYILDPKFATGGGEVSSLKFHVFTSGDTIRVGELDVKSIKVLHGSHSDGRDYYANGYSIGGFTYLSDVSGLPEESMDLLQSLQTDLLVLDCLFEAGSYRSHYCWPQAEQFIKTLSPKVSVLVGMAHNIDYYRFQRRLDMERGIEPAADGVVGKLHHVDGRVYVGFDGMLLRFKDS